MTKTARRVSRPVARAPFHRGAYVHQYALSKEADQWIDQHDPDGGPLPALIGSPELGGRRGSNRSEITPAFLYHAVRDALPTDAGEPVMVTTASGEVMTVEDLEHLNAEVSIDHVSQHATTAHRDRRLMSAASITRTRYVGPCHRTIAGAWTSADRWETVATWTRDRITRDGRIVRSTCPVPCPKGCKADHRHVRHQHRDAGTLYVHQTAPYGGDGLSRRIAGTRSQAGRWISKRQGRRVRRVSLGSWTDATYQADSDHDGLGAYVVADAIDTAGTVAHQWHQWHAPAGTADAIARTVDTRWYVKDDASGTVTGLDTPEVRPIAYPLPMSGDVRPIAPRPISRPVIIRSWVKRSAEYVTLPADWARVPFVPVKVRADRPGPAPAPLATLDRTRLLRRIAADPDLTALAGRLLLSAEHAWTTNGQPVRAEQGLTLRVWPPIDDRPPWLTIVGPDDQTVAQGSYKARASVVREAVAAIV